MRHDPSSTPPFSNDLLRPLPSHKPILYSYHKALALYRLYERLVSDGTFDSTLANLYEMGRKLNWQQKLRTAVLPEVERFVQPSLRII